MGRRKGAPEGVFVVSLGCPKNLVDTEVMAGELVSNGYALTMDENLASIYLINTCAFLPSARAEAEEAIHEALRWKRRKLGRRVVVAGCLNEKLRDGEAQTRFPGVDVWLRVDAIPKLAEILRGGEVPVCGGEPTYLADHASPRLVLTLPHVVYLKISDGCDNRCSYCSIPGIRGGLRTRSLDSVVAEARQLLEYGARELVVIAQDITAYGHDRPESGDTIGKLIRTLNALPGDFRMRLLYTHPAHYTDEFIDAMAECDKVVPYLDIPLQHINDRILKAMGRKTTRAQIEALLKKMRERIPNLVVRTTFITGFPGETEAEFAELAAFLEAQRFERCGVFPYAPEPGTPAARLADQISGEVAEARAAALMEKQEAIMLARHREWIGRTDRVLIDAVSGNQAWGRGTLDAPDIDNELVISGAKNLQVGEFYDIVIKSATAYELKGEVCREPGGRGARK